MTVHRLGHSAASQGWRKRAADVVAPRLPIANERARELLGLLFFALSVKYVVSTLRRATS
jgi:hypothetical protein